MEKLITDFVPSQESIVRAEQEVIEKYHEEIVTRARQLDMQAHIRHTATAFIELTDGDTNRNIQAIRLLWNMFNVAPYRLSLHDAKQYIETARHEYLMSQDIPF
jgi:hypothetical protein